MKNAINKIDFADDITGERYQINLDGKNLIITGNNGSGKTQFLQKIKDELVKIVNSYNLTIQTQLERELNQYKSLLPGVEQSSDDYERINGNIIRLEKELLKWDLFNIELEDADLFKSEVSSKKSFIKFFPAYRQANIQNDGRITSREHLLKEFVNSRDSQTDLDSGIFFEKYLVTIWNYSLLKKGSGDLDDYNRVFEIITNIEKDLRELFEDKTLKLNFNLEELKIYIQQKGKKPFGLNQLSSGFSSVLAIYANLLINCELEKLSKNTIKGIVIVDEIDAHLHVTLQKKVFSFFSNAFPNIQFIISTHSPFVIQSVDDSVIFNLGSHEQMENLSLYSYTSIIKGLLGEDSVSQVLSENIKEMNDLIKSGDFNNRLAELVDLLSSKERYLDAQSKVALMFAKNKILDRDEGE